MKASNVYHMVFSSSCTVYGDPEHLPITEDHPTGAVTNVYGRTKYLIEEMLKDLSRAEEVSVGDFNSFMCCSISKGILEHLGMILIPYWNISIN